MARRVLLLINTKSGRIRPRRSLRIIRRELERLDIPFAYRLSSEVHELAAAAGEAGVSGFTEVIVWGGDGTVSRIAERLINSDIILTILPGGTGNILARYLDIPMNLKRAVRMMMQGKDVHRMDALRIGPNVYFLNVSIGMSSLTITQVKSRAKRFFGLLSYVGGLLSHFFRLNPMNFSITADETNYSVRGRELILCNAGFRKTPLASIFQTSDPFDGKMECYFLIAEDAGSFFAMIADVVTGKPRRTQRYLQKIEFRKSFSVDVLPALPIQADGDRINPHRFEVKVASGALRITVPPFIDK